MQPETTPKPLLEPYLSPGGIQMVTGMLMFFDQKGQQVVLMEQPLRVLEQFYAYWQAAVATGNTGSLFDAYSTQAQFRQCVDKALALMGVIEPGDLYWRQINELLFNCEEGTPLLFRLHFVHPKLPALETQVPIPHPSAASTPPAMSPPSVSKTPISSTSGHSARSRKSAKSNTGAT